MTSKTPAPEVTPDDIMENPTKYGLPTFEDYCKDRERYLGYSDQLFRTIDAGPQNAERLRKLMHKMRFRVAGHYVKTVEKLQSVAREEWGDDVKLEMYPQMLPIGGGKWECVVEVMPKSQGDALGGITHADRLRK